MSGATDCPRRVFAFWTGSNALTERRKACLDSFAVTGLDPILVHRENLSEWVVRGCPLHPAYDLLSPVHRSDYLRPYFMFHHGGGYADIKTQTGSWLPAVERLESSYWFWGSGYREIRGGVVNLDLSEVCETTFVLGHAVPRFVARMVTNGMRAFRPLLIGNGAFYFRRHTPYARTWLSEVERRLDLLLPALKVNAPAEPRDRSTSGSGYPVPWSFLMGDVNAPLALLHAPRLLRALPRPSFVDYQ